MPPVTPNTPIQRVLSQFEQRNGSRFAPNRELFYDRVGINQKRFGMLLRGELPMYVFEVVNLAKFFGVEVMQLIEDKPPNEQKSPTTVPAV